MTTLKAAMTLANRQMDGSFHEWLEERGPRACLMHMVDVATTTELFNDPVVRDGLANEL